MNQRITIIGLVLLMTATGCSTEKNTLVTRSYHNLTSRYNIFFNGNENYQQGIKRMQDSHSDDFSRTLQIFIYGDPDVASGITSDMQTAIQKATKVITLHSITVKPEFKDGPRSEKQKAFYERNEYNIFVPDNYLMMGKAYLYMQDYNLAIETFKYILSEYPYDEVKFEAQVWLARTYNELGNFDEAYDILEVLTGNTEFPEKLYTDLYTTLADYFMKQENYDGAIDPLSRAVRTVKKKRDRIRYTFILAQLYQETDQAEQASTYYRKVIQMNPSYEFSFNSRIKRAGVFIAGSDRSKEIKDELQKMLKDEKNNDFRDQIYYAIGNVYFREGNTDEALDYYKLSSTSSVSNTQQKTTSCLTLADIYYEKQEYKLASLYYDSAKVYLSEPYPGYELIVKKASSLGELVQNLEVVQTEDSLQRLATMEESDRLAVIDSIIMNLQRAEQRAREEEMAAMQEQQYNRLALNESQRTGFSEDISGNWYFYNQAAKGFGQPEFRMKWGNRSLEDNWRRSNKRAINFGEVEEFAEDTSAAGAEQMKILSNKSREFYLQDIPFTDSMMEISHGRIMAALYNAGNIYKNNLMDYPRSIGTYQDLLNRYPRNDYTLSVYFNLYELYREENDTQMAGIYRELIVSEFPESRPALVLTNPNYAEELRAEKNLASRFYEQTYRNYQRGYYEQVMSDVDTALVRFKNDPLIPRFQFLKVLSIGRTRDILLFTRALDSLAGTTSDPEVAESANGILAYILASDEVVKTETQKIEAEEIYRLDSTGNFYFGMFLSEAVDINQLTFEFINFNLDHYPNRTFDVVHQVLGNKDVVLFVKQFTDPEQTWVYADQAGSDELITGVFGDTAYKSIIISATNAEILLQDGEPDKYWLFFQKHYIR